MGSSIDRFTAIVLAADRGPSDPVAMAAGVRCKALTPVGGRPMVLRVLDALDNAQEIESCILCGPHWSVIEQEHELHTRIVMGLARWVEPQATPSSSAYSVMKSLPEQTSVVITTADHPLLTTEIVDYFCSKAHEIGSDVAVGLAPYELVEKAYPGVKRTVVKLRDNGYCGCNLFAIMTARGRAAAEFWQEVEAQRKQPLRLIRTLGWTAVLRYILRQLSLSSALEELSQRLDLRIKSVLLPFPEAAVDVDTINDWKLAEVILKGSVSNDHNQPSHNP